MKRRKSAPAAGSGGLAINAAKAAVIAMVITLVLLLVIACAVSKGALGEKSSENMMLGSVVAATTIGGIYCAASRAGE